MTVAAVGGLACQGGEDPGSGGPGAPGPGNAQCHITADYPHESSGTPGSIVGKVRAVCTAAIDSLTFEAKLQELIKGKWADVGQPDARSVAPVVANEKYTVQATVPCPADGSAQVYRTAGRGSGVYGGNPAKSADWQYSSPMGREVKCRTR